MSKLDTLRRLGKDRTAAETAYTLALDFYQASPKGTRGAAKQVAYRRWSELKDTDYEIRSITRQLTSGINLEGLNRL